MSKLKVIDNPKTIEDLFLNLAKEEEIPISIHNQHMKNHALLRFHDGEDMPYIVIRDKVKSMENLKETEITFFYKETFINFLTELEKITEETFYIQRPERIRTSYKRTKTRYQVEVEDNVYVIFYGMSDRYRVIDMSTSGFSMEMDRDVFEKSHHIRNIMIILGKEGTIYVDGVVKYVKEQGDGSYRYGVEFLNIEWMFYQKIFTFTFKKLYPDIKQFKDIPMEDLTSLYNESKYIRPKNTIPQKSYLDDFLKIDALKDKPMISINLIKQRDEEIDAIASAVRTSNETFYIANPFWMNGEGDNEQKLDIYAGITDSLLGHPYFEAAQMFIDSDCEWDIELFRIIRDIIGDEEKISLCGMRVIDCLVDEVQESNEDECYNFGEIVNPQTIIKAIKSQEIAIRTLAKGYSLDNFYKDRVREDYRAFNLEIERKAYVLLKEKEPTIFFIQEATSVNIDLDGNLNHVVVYFKQKPKDEKALIRAIKSKVSPLYKRMGVTQFKILWMCDEPLEDIPSRYMFELLMNREGVAEFLYFLKANTV